MNLSQTQRGFLKNFCNDQMGIFLFIFSEFLLRARILGHFSQDKKLGFLGFLKNLT